MAWREPKNHVDDCYFCLTNISGFNAYSRKRIKYPNLPSSIKPIFHFYHLTVPTTAANKDLISTLCEEILSREDSTESFSLEDIKFTYYEASGKEPHWITRE